MGHFRGTVQGHRGEASRLGTKSAGMRTTCNGWTVGCTANAHYNEKKGEDIISIDLTTGSGYGGSVNLFHGSEHEAKKIIDERPRVVFLNQEESEFLKTLLSWRMDELNKINGDCPEAKAQIEQCLKKLGGEL